MNSNSTVSDSPGRRRLSPLGDATTKGLDEGTREWPPEIEMTPEVKARVDARWAELGLPAR